MDVTTSGLARMNMILHDFPTANIMAGERERCIASGMDDYVSKPFNTKDIATVLQKWAAAKRQEA